MNDYRYVYLALAHLFLFWGICCSIAINPESSGDDHGNPKSMQPGQEDGTTDEPNANPPPGPGDEGNPPVDPIGQEDGTTDEPNQNPRLTPGDEGNPPEPGGQENGTTDEPSDSDGGDNTTPGEAVGQGNRDGGDGLQTRLLALQKELREKDQENSELGKKIESLLKRITKLELALMEPRIHPEVLDLRGPFKKTLILIDMSGSMTDERAGDALIPWRFTNEQMTRWLKRLKLAECAIIFFSEDISTFPTQTGQYCDVSVDDAKRAEITEYLDSKAKHGVSTDMLKALDTAYTEYSGLDTIVMFTDFKPETDSSTPDELRADILALCKSHPNIPINCIGLGGYDSNSEFLRQIVRVTNGTFLGR